MLLFVGLGNPGAKYARNRHNIGFMAVDEIVRRHRFGPFRSRFQALVAEGTIAGEKVIALEPMTYMNESGRSVAEAVRFYKLSTADIVVFHDDIDLAPGKVRVKRGGGAAGHNGLRSLDRHLDSDYRRVRLGVGRPQHKDDVHDYVLRDFAKADRDWLDHVLDAVAAEAPRLAQGDDPGFMSRIALLTSPLQPNNNPTESAPPTEDETR